MSVVNLLNVGDVITVRLDIRKYVLARYTTYNLQVGMGVQIEHSSLMQESGMELELFDDTYPLDRIVNVQRQDDKVATFKTKNGLICKSHTVGGTEKPAWAESPEDTIIQSFELVRPDDMWTAKYCGAFSFKKLHDNLAFMDSVDNRSSYFYRNTNSNSKIL